jgi:integrase
VPSTLMEHLGAYLGTWRPNAPGLLFATRNGTPLDHSLVRKRKFHPLLKKLGIPQCGFRAFRHGNATLLDQIGVRARNQNNLDGGFDTCGRNAVAPCSGRGQRIVARISPVRHRS